MKLRYSRCSLITREPELLRAVNVGQATRTGSLRGRLNPSIFLGKVTLNMINVCRDLVYTDAIRTLRSLLVNITTHN